ncbi:hypothetical protein V5O48_012348 [Marasmius crinis-equi]
MCVIFYGSSKVLIYCFLVEKVHLVWSPTAETGGRLKSRIWLFCTALNMGYVVVLVLMCLGLIHYYRADGACVIGLQPFSSIPLIAFDLFITILLNVLFIYPLVSAKIANPKLRAVVIRTVAASIVALITSTVNIAILTMLHGHELGWVCLGSCGTDVILNALTIFYVTRGSEGTTSLGGETSDRGNSNGMHTTQNGVAVKGSGNTNQFKLGTGIGRNNQANETHKLQVSPNFSSSLFLILDADGSKVMVTTRTSMDRDGESLSSTKGYPVAPTP